MHRGCCLGYVNLVLFACGQLWLVEVFGRKESGCEMSFQLIVSTKVCTEYRLVHPFITVIGYRFSLLGSPQSTLHR